MEAALRAIAEPRRQQILALVRDEELSAGEIATHFEVTRPAVSQHLTVLKQAGLISERREGTRRLYRVRPEGLDDLRKFLEEFWDEKLTALKREAERKEKQIMDATAEKTSVEREVAIAARPETVWKLLTEPGQAVRWMGKAATFELHSGGRYRVEVLPGHIASGKFLEIDPPRRLVYTWGWESETTTVPSGSTTVVFELLPRGAGTLLRFSHRDLPGAAAADSHAHGWDHYLERLTVVAGGGDPGPDPWIEHPERRTSS